VKTLLIEQFGYLGGTATASLMINLNGFRNQVEPEPYESHRAMIPIMAIGQAAGTAAALSAKGDVMPRNLDVPALQETLIQQGAELRK
jgi:hypothetical protein